MSHTTARKWLSLLRAGYIIEFLRPHHRNFSKRLVKSPKLYFTDTGLLCRLLGIRKAEDLLFHPLRGAIFESFIVVELPCSSTAATPISDKGIMCAGGGIALDKPGSGILIHNDATWVTLYGNIVSRSCSIFGGISSETCAGIQARDNQVPPQKPDQYSSYRDLLWFNKNANQAYVDYLPDEVGNTMKGQNDKNHETGENHPHFEGVIGSPSSGDYSFMLQHDEDDDNECYQKTNYLSEGIDEGPEQELYYDQQPPGLKTPRCDIGAYGGPRARWGSESEPCKEYLGLPPFTECN